MSFDIEETNTALEELRVGYWDNQEASELLSFEQYCAHLFYTTRDSMEQVLRVGSADDALELLRELLNGLYFGEGQA